MSRGEDPAHPPTYFAEELSVRHDVPCLHSPGEDPACTGLDISERPHQRAPPSEKKDTTHLDHVHPAEWHRFGHDSCTARGVPGPQQRQGLGGQEASPHEEAEQSMGISLGEVVVHLHVPHIYNTSQARRQCMRSSHPTRPAARWSRPRTPAKTW